MDRYFDTIYYTLAILIFLALSYSAMAGLRLRARVTKPLIKRRALGVASAAVGTVIALLGGLFADAFLKSSIYFQQARFISYYAGFTLITAGLVSTTAAVQVSYPLPKVLSQSKVLSLIIWFLFLGTLAISVFYLVDPQTFIYNPSGHQVQRVIYWIPMLAVTFAGTVLLFLLAFEIKDSSQREYLFWMGAFAALLFVGLLRESLILPDLGDPLANLLIAFIPFTIGSLCLGFGSRKLFNG